MVAVKKKYALTLKACAVQVLRRYRHEPEGEQVQLVKDLARIRGIRWCYGHEITEALTQARKYELKKLSRS